MSQFWKAQFLGVGIMTPALTGLPHAAAARIVDIDARNAIESLDVASHDAAIRLLQEGVFALTPAEKLKIGGDRIRLGEATTKPETKGYQTPSPQGTVVHGKQQGATRPNARPGFLSIRCNHTCHCTAYSGACC
jgi:hypothetical protein